jgi:hypothetical protein
VGPAKSFGCTGNCRRSARRDRGRRDAEFGNSTYVIEVNGDDPEAQIDENLPIEVKYLVKQSLFSQSKWSTIKY